MYKLIVRPILEKWNLSVTDEFWFFLSLGILSLVYTFKDPGIFGPLIFFVGAIVTLVLNNSIFFRRKFFTSSQVIINSFLSKLSQKELHDVLDFIKGHELDSKQIRLLLNSNFKDNYTLYEYIYRYQNFQSDLILFIANRDLYKIMGIDLFLKYIFKVSDFVSLKDYKKLKAIFKNELKVLKAINIMYPMYLKDNDRFKLYASINIGIRNTLNFGSFNIIAFLFSLFLIAKLVIFDYNTYLDPLGYIGIYYVLEIISKFAIFFILVTILSYLIIYLVNFLVNLYTKILFIYSPLDSKIIK